MAVARRYAHLGCKPQNSSLTLDLLLTRVGPVSGQDHDDCDGRSDVSYSRHGLLVRGARAVAIGLQVEHQHGDLVLWEGEGGAVFMFQAELPYKDANYSSAGFRVVSSVTAHSIVGGGVYAIGSLYPVPVGVRLPSTATATNLFVWAINSMVADRFGHVVCTGTSSDQKCYPGQCDYVSCRQLALP